ncbi:hypothetical protein PSI22_06485 [Xenorhabdus sp. XENO-7]|uniref:Transposase n=1 Tax=Xenorhabdus aichiensis TaxID=3025874 RepID=A0ABT5M0T9_9GAMM|nr:darcynin family protein [Xenorhabdus aichiensis]MDC9621289.1 hypothetical protein [Xenorhabdus aichiensis]
MSQSQHFTPALTVFMLVKTTPEWLSFSIDQRLTLQTLC